MFGYLARLPELYNFFKDVPRLTISTLLVVHSNRGTLFINLD